MDPRIIRRRARQRFNKALATGRVKRATKCELCQSQTRLHAHHSDYSQPFSVQWLCLGCHGVIHPRPRLPKAEILPNIARIDIRELRRNLGLSQERFARVIGCAIGTVRYWEAGHRPRMAEHVQAIHDTYALLPLNSN